mmetsp:Transcript_8901/g.20219  ORF Transcript_8901/g.20219 Transcript_8901/m.20219 type:complete len:81 (-) Transcript_8901:311-553(-)
MQCMIVISTLSAVFCGILAVSLPPECHFHSLRILTDPPPHPPPHSDLVAKLETMQSKLSVFLRSPLRSQLRQHVDLCFHV